VAFSSLPATTPALRPTTSPLGLVGGSSYPFHDDAGHCDHQRVITTRWWASFPFQRQCRPIRSPTSHCDSLVGFPFPSNDNAGPTTTNESSRIRQWVFLSLPRLAFGSPVLGRQWHGSSPGCPKSDPHPDPAGFCPQ
jgi:hypothetical protein